MTLIFYSPTSERQAGNRVAPRGVNLYIVPSTKHLVMRDGLIRSGEPKEMRRQGMALHHIEIDRRL
jgi:hypothetical protein